jgi:hypothetical protein
MHAVHPAHDRYGLTSLASPGSGAALLLRFARRLRLCLRHRLSRPQASAADEGGEAAALVLDAVWSRMTRSATVARSAAAEMATSASHSDGRRKRSSQEQYCAPIVATISYNLDV